MIPVQITLQFARDESSKSARMQLDLEGTVRETLQGLVDALELPREAHDRHYQLLRNRQVLRGEDRLYEAGIEEGDILQLVAVDPKATTFGRIITPNVLSRLGGNVSGDELPVKAALVAAGGTPVFRLRRTRALIGRADARLGYPADALDADLTPLDPNQSVSRPHALIVFLDNAFTIRDLYSQLGVQVNGAPVAANKSTPLSDGDTITAGDVTLTFRIER